MEVVMLRNVFIALAIVITLVLVAGASAEMKEGLWEITTKAEMKGMPVQIPPTTMKQCITKKDLVPKPEKQEKGQECKMQDQKVSGDTVTYTMECKTAESTMTSTGTITYKGDSYNGTTNTTMKAKGQPDILMTGKMTGKYIGPCTKEK
ncbi:MAG: hypothetical protein C0399_06780 [Syntrophus sp. (in: bacteria)]|nr:hypothetical protein [Syntrophus sp. (in: bacteria)]